MNLWLQDGLASLAARWFGAQVVYSAYYGNVCTNAAEVYVVYDMIHELYPAYFPHDHSLIRRFIEEKRRCLERAALLIAISPRTAEDIRRFYPCVSPAKIQAIPLGVDARFFETRAPQIRTNQRPYFVFTGQRGGYKNFLRLLEAFGQSSLAREVDLRVLVAHPDTWSEAEQAVMARYQLQRSVHMANALDDEALRDHYAGALALVYPSEYEGFGLPILEAMASSTLVATSSTASMPYVGGDAAFYFDPLKTETIAECLRRVAALSSEERQARVTHSVAHARSFTWEACQHQTVQALVRLL
jgi:glycosyltransferase involved in cell wall biosynthesis